MKSKSRPNLFLSAAGVLLCLVLLSAHFTSGMYARFVTRAAGSDSGRLAEFQVSAKHEGELKLLYGNSAENKAEYDIQISNGSDVAVSYSIEITFDDAVTQDQITSVELGNAERPFQSTVTFENVGRLAPGQTGRMETLTLDLSAGFEGLGDGLDFSNSTNGTAGDCPFTVTVTFSQVD